MSAPAVPNVTVHRAYRYTGKGALKANAGKQLVALDVEFRDFDSGLDLDDVDIVDALSGRALQSAPEIAFLRSDGSFYAWRKAQPNGPMIFQIPGGIKSVGLKLSGESITKSPVTIRSSGPTLPPEGLHP